MIELTSFENVLKDIKNGGRISVSGGSLHCIKDTFCIGKMFGGIDIISEEEAFEYIKKYVEEENLDNFLINVVNNVKDNKPCKISKRRNWFAKHIEMDSSRYEIKLKRCNKDRVMNSTSKYVSGLHIAKAMKPYTRKIKFSELLLDMEGVKSVNEDFYEFEMDRELGVLYNHNINVNFDKLLHSEEDEVELTDLISKIIQKAF